MTITIFALTFIFPYVAIVFVLSYLLATVTWLSVNKIAVKIFCLITSRTIPVIKDSQSHSFVNF